MNLSQLISSKGTLTPEQRAEVVQLLGYRCSEKTKDALNRVLRFTSNLPTYSLYERLQVVPIVDYCGAQDCTEELRTIRNLLLNRG